jgi:hypothetical protein
VGDRCAQDKKRQCDDDHTCQLANKNLFPISLYSDRIKTRSFHFILFIYPLNSKTSSVLLKIINNPSSSTKKKLGPTAKATLNAATAVAVSGTAANDAWMSGGGTILLLLTVNMPTQYNLGAAESWRHPGFKPPSWEVFPSCTLTHWVDQSNSKVLVARMSRAAAICFFCAF